LLITPQVLFAIGRDASTSGMGLEAVGVQLDKYGDISRALFDRTSDTL
jgi:pyruvate/2-oxoglutarate dehydrogenase complex dihydrolipoamide dehydrogenase (E3) component